jgi:hypothetical protein
LPFALSRDALLNGYPIAGFIALAGYLLWIFAVSC